MERVDGKMWKKDIVQWEINGKLFLSVPFTWLMPEAEKVAKESKKRVCAGGPAVQLMGAPWADHTSDTTPYDVLSMHNPLATFTTRGCIRKCGFCAVPKIEGDFKEMDTWKPAPIVCDNNLLAASKKHIERVIDSLMAFPYVDFNQGLDARLFSLWHADQISRLKHAKVRFALDHVDMIGTVYTAIAKAKNSHLNDIGVYVLYGFNDTPEDALHRLDTVRSWGIRPNPMRYQPLDTLDKNSYIKEGWTDYELRKVMSYYSKLRYLEHIPYDDYVYAGDDMPLFAKLREER